MNSSEQINAIASALSKAQGEMGHAAKGSTNPHFRSKYADIAAVITAVREPFAKHGLSFVQLPQPSEANEVAIETVLMHSSGQWVSSLISIPVSKHDAQGFGSVITYARRYGLQAIAGLAADDDDGNAAVSAAPKARESTGPESKVAELIAKRDPGLHAYFNGLTDSEKAVAFNAMNARQIGEWRKLMQAGIAENGHATQAEAYVAAIVEHIDNDDDAGLAEIHAELNTDVRIFGAVNRYLSTEQSQRLGAAATGSTDEH